MIKLFFKRASNNYYSKIYSYSIKNNLQKNHIKPPNNYLLALVNIKTISVINIIISVLSIAFKASTTSVIYEIPVNLRKIATKIGIKIVARKVPPIIYPKNIFKFLSIFSAIRFKSSLVARWSRELFKFSTFALASLSETPALTRLSKYSSVFMLAISQSPLLVKSLSSYFIDRLTHACYNCNNNLQDVC